MTLQATQLLDDALKLSNAERADLAACLLASLEGDPAEPPSKDWEREIQRRLDSITDGSGKLTPWPVARKRMFDNA